ncbi:hypothetical protein [Novosphingobium sp. HII-3]|nr:hypothetical protein [Novosphingobium sp. HII-3]
MPEYIALIHYRSEEENEQGPPPSSDEVTAAFARMEMAGIAKVH